MADEPGRPDRWWVFSAADDAALDRFLRGLNHPLRRRILALLADGQEGGAKTLAGMLEAPLPNVSYHLNKVLAEECGLVELVERIPRRGAEEKIYRLDEEAIAVALEAIRCPSCPGSSSDCPAERG